MARTIHDDAKSDEKLIVGVISHPKLRERKHSEAVIQLPIFNKSKRKAYIDGLSVYDASSKQLDVKWSGEIDDLGNTKHEFELVGIIDTATIYIRRLDGEEIMYARVLFSHSFSNIREVVIFDSLADFK